MAPFAAVQAVAFVVPGAAAAVGGVAAFVAPVSEAAEVAGYNVAAVVVRAGSEAVGYNVVVAVALAFVAVVAVGYNVAAVVVRACSEAVGYCVAAAVAQDVPGVAGCYVVVLSVAAVVLFLAHCHVALQRLYSRVHSASAYPA